MKLTESGGWKAVPLVLALLPGVAGAAAPAEPASEPLRDLSVAFKLDRQVLDVTFGDRWLPGPLFTGAVQAGSVGTVDVRVEGRDASGRPLPIAPEWTVADPDMLTVTPGRRGEYRITVTRPGESRLTVASQGLARALLVRARDLGDAIQVEVRQGATTGRGEGAAPEAAVDRNPEPADVVTDTSLLPDQRARRSYALGLEMGERLKETPVELDFELVSRGVRDALIGEGALLSEAEMKTALASLRAEFREKGEEARQKARRRLAEENREAGEAFLAANRAREGVVTLDSGVQYRVLTAADGPKPGAEDRVVCRYRGTTIDGREFDSSFERDEPATVSLKHAIRGWSEALQLMPVGSRWQIFVPAGLAYGERGTRRIGPNETLVFEVELVAIGDAET